jgi:hypothetical protein
MTETPVPLAEQIKALKRIMFVGIVSDDDIDAVCAILATLEQHERAMAALRFIATVADQAHPNAARQMADFAKAALAAARETDRE